jgi:teichuronic acid biosynthesis glycosyltransferase TuaC
MLSRSYPSAVFPNLGLWVARPTELLNARDGVEVRVVSPQPYCPPLPRIRPWKQYARFRAVAHAEELNGVEVRRPRYPTGPGRSTYRFESGAYEIGISRVVARLHNEFPFDVIHAHFVYPEGVVASRLARRYDVPFVLTEHAPWIPEWFSTRAVRNRSLAAGRAASGIMAVSTYVGRSIETWLGDTVPVAFVPTGVDCDLFTLPATRSIVEDRILFVGWPNFNKGTDVLLRAMDLIRRRGDPGRLLLVGGAYFRATRVMEAKIRELAGELDLGDRVQFAGPRPQAEVAGLMGTSAVLVLPSRMEASGTVLVEAMACGTPVVATRCGGPEDYVTPDVGRLVAVDDHVALADALVEVLRDRARFDPQTLRRYALDRFAWPRIVDGWLGAYDRALGRGARDVPEAAHNRTAVRA